MTKLFLLKPNFTDPNKDSEGTLYYCPHNALMEGVLKYYPQLEKEIEIQYVDFKRPRPLVIAEIGEENQSCPVLVADKKETGNESGYFSEYGDKLFMNDENLILKYFAEQFGIGIAH